MKSARDILIVILCSSFCGHVGAQVVPTKALAIEKYKNEYEASGVKEVKEIKWKGNLSRCKEGSISDKVMQKAFMRINYFRTLCGLSAIEFTNEFNQKAQKAALITYANNETNHDPPTHSKCYSKDAADAAGASSLALTDFVYYPEIAFITAFIKDNGNSNKSVGHRRAMLHSRAIKKGYGATSGSEAIYDDEYSLLKRDTTLVPKYFSYPVSGYNEIDLLFPRWSFSIPEAYKVDFTQSIVELKDETGKQINIATLPFTEFYDPTLVWELKDKLNRDFFLKHVITVTVSNVRVNDQSRRYSYDVQFFDYVQSAPSKK